MDLKTAIKILELKKFQGIEDLKRCFYRLAHRYHPDKNPNEDSQIFRDVLGAYEYALKHIPELFDYFGLKHKLQDEVTARTTIENLDDIFEDIFGFSKSGRVLGFQEPQKITLRVEDLFFGTRKRQKMVAYVKCPECGGNGARRGTAAKLCTYCFGHGTIKGQRLCPKCQGRGRDVPRKCGRCDGFGRLRRHHWQEFAVPVGLKPGEMYTLDSLDLDTNEPTEIFVKPEVLPHPIFQIDKYDLLCEYRVDFKKLRQPLPLTLKTPIGKIPITIPADAKEGDRIRVRNRGLYKDRHLKKRGDLVVTLKDRRRSLLSRLFGGIFGT